MGQDMPAAGAAPATARALESCRREAWRRLAAAAAADVVALVVWAEAYDAQAHRLARWAAFASAVSLGATAHWTIHLIRYARMRAVLLHRPWQACAAVSDPRLPGAIALRDPGRAEPRLLSVRDPGHLAVRDPGHRFPAVEPGLDGVVWWCGEADRGVVAEPGGGTPLWARPLRGHEADRRLLHRFAEEHGLRERPVPHPAVYGTAPPAPRRHRVFRWIVLAGVAVAALGITWSESSDGDPQVDLTVHAEDSAGHCRVSWSDPWSGQTRHGAFHCDPHRDRLLRDWESGFVVSYGPWKGDLYSADWAGTPANYVNDGLIGAGALTVVAGLAGGGLGLYTRRRVKPQFTGARVAFAKGAAAKPAPLTYAVLAAAAERQALPRTAYDGRPAESVTRETPWWRVPALRRLSRAPAAARCAAGSAALLSVWWYGGHHDEYPQTVLWGGILAVQAGVHGYHAVTRGVPNARALIRAARTPAAEPRRYVLLHTQDRSPVLVFFDAHGGPDSEPMEVLPLFPPRTVRHPGRRNTRLPGGLPAPVGTAELHGRPAAVVPWTAGRPLWSRHELLTVNLADPLHTSLLRDLTRDPPPRHLGRPATSPGRASLVPCRRR